MRYWSAVTTIGLLALGTALNAPGSAQDKSDIKLDIVKYDGLKDAVTRNRGKVVLVDFWGTT
jgi:hypothetical protein